MQPGHRGSSIANSIAPSSSPRDVSPSGGLVIPGKGNDMPERTRSDSPTKSCTLDGCDKPLRARGLCSSHYNTKHQPNRHAKRRVACVVCGTSVLRHIDATRVDSHCCSVACRTIRQFGMLVTGASYDWNADAKARARKAGVHVEDVDRMAVLERDSWRCYICDVDTSLDRDPFSPASATVDHVTPLTAGGAHAMSNVRCCCLRCNSSKAARALPAA